MARYPNARISIIYGLVIFRLGLPLYTVYGGNPYASIVQRNVFGLRPLPVVVTEATHGPLPHVQLTGITTILKGKRALLKVDFPTRPPERPKEESYILKEGERAGPIEVLEINERLAQVKVNNSGVITNITFEKIAPAPAPAQLREAAARQTPLPYRPAYRLSVIPRRN